MSRWRRLGLLCLGEDDSNLQSIVLKQGECSVNVGRRPQRWTLRLRGAALLCFTAALISRSALLRHFPDSALLQLLKLLQVAFPNLRVRWNCFLSKATDCIRFAFDCIRPYVFFRCTSLNDHRFVDFCAGRNFVD